MADRTNHPSRETEDLCRDLFVWDNVFPIDLPTQISVGNSWEALERFRAANVDIVSLTLAGDNHNAAEALSLCGWARRQLREAADRFLFIRSVDDIDRAQTDDRLGIILHFEGTRCFERNLDHVELFYDVGIRQALLAFNAPNSVGGGCAEPDAGLSAFGRRLVAEMARVGMIIDLSHTGYRTSMDAVEAAGVPVMFSHSNAAAVHESFRNLRDDQIEACASGGGLIGISSLSDYLGEAEASPAAIFRHIDYLAQKVGAKHVCLGLDFIFDAAPLNAYARSRLDEWPMAKDPDWPGFKTAAPEQIVDLVDLMLEAGYGRADIAGILGTNLQRFCGEVWR